MVFERSAATHGYTSPPRHSPGFEGNSRIWSGSIPWHFDDWEVQPRLIHCSTSVGQQVSELPLLHESISGFGTERIDQCSDLDFSLVRRSMTSRFFEVIPPELRNGLSQHYNATAVAANHLLNAVSGDLSALLPTGGRFPGSGAVELTLHAHDQLPLICFDTLNQEVLPTPTA